MTQQKKEKKKRKSRKQEYRYQVVLRAVIGKMEEWSIDTTKKEEKENQENRKIEIRWSSELLFQVSVSGANTSH